MPKQNTTKKSTGQAGPVTAAGFIKDLKAKCSQAELEKYKRFFKFSDSKPLVGDEFIGVRMGHVFALAKEYVEMPPKEIEKLLESRIHEVRAGALSIMGKQAASKQTPATRLKELAELYLRRHDRINNWDLVDLAAYHVVGRYLNERPRGVLYKLARSKNVWERRTAIVSTAHFIRQGDVGDTYKIAEILLDDKQDTIHKATGWMLRAAGTVDRKQLVTFLDRHAAEMPRTTLRYAIEHFDAKERARYLNRT